MCVFRTGSIGQTWYSNYIGGTSWGAGIAQWRERLPPTNEFVVGSRLAMKLFLRVFRFSSLHKNQHLQMIEDPYENQLKGWCGFLTKNLIFNFLLHQRSSGFTRTKIARIVEYGLEEITLRLLDDFG